MHHLVQSPILPVLPPRVELSPVLTPVMVRPTICTLLPATRLPEELSDMTWQQQQQQRSKICMHRMRRWSLHTSYAQVVFAHTAATASATAWRPS